MESFDREKARRVWDRVTGGCDRSPDPDVLNALMCHELTDAATLTRLSKQIGGRGGDLLRLARQCRQRAGSLRGICAMAGQAHPCPAIPMPAVTTAGGALRKCYVNSFHRMREYERMSADPDYGPVFQTMAATTRRQCAALLELIGKTEP